MTTTLTPETVSPPARLYLRLALVPDIGPIRAKNLIDQLGSVEAVFSASLAELQRVEQIGPKTAQSIFASRNNDELAEREVARAAECGARILCPLDADFPKPLLHIPDPPICLYVKGSLLPTDAVAVAIVGTRRCSHYGQEQAGRFAESLATAGFTVVSGMARGIDGCAHASAVRAGGRTFAVLGNGLANVYPPEHASLADDIANHGALMTELPIDTAPDAKNFPPRNRIIAGLSLGVIVIEAGKKSGALITARLACEYNREVFALPGRVDRPEVSAGVNALIRDQHAKLITCLDDVLDELKEVGKIMRSDANAALAAGSASASAAANADFTGNPRTADRSTIECRLPLSDAERAIVDALRAGAEDVDRICAHAGQTPGAALATLTKLQLRGLVKRLPGDRFEAK